MSLLDRLERRWSSWAVPNLISLVVGGQALVFVLQNISPGMGERMVLYKSAVLNGEVWRLMTFLFLPPGLSFFWIIFYFLLLWTMGQALEAAWGPFRLNVYYLCGALASALPALLFQGTVATGHYLNLTLFLAFATLFPDFKILVFFILPVKVRYLAYLDAAFLAWGLVTGSMADRLMILAGMFNYILFFGVPLWRAMRNRRWIASQRSGEPTRHSCQTCGASEAGDPELEFRYCDECDREFCMEHMKSHRHPRVP